MSARRDFIKNTSILAGSLALIKTTKLDSPTLLFADDSNSSYKKHVLPELSYKYEALEPYIDRETMQLHHSIHHKAYVDGLNKAEIELSKLRQSGDYSLIEHWSKKAAFHGGGHFLHTLFWESMTTSNKQSKSAKGGVLEDNKIKKMIIRDFSSFENFKNHFSNAAISVEGSGWAVLHFRKEDSKLIILQAENQHKLSSWGTVPILAIDVWEHAYYLRYKNKRSDYVQAWWNIVNWDAVNDKVNHLSDT